VKRGLLTSGFLAGACFAGATAAWAGQAPGAASDPDIPISHRDRVYSAEQFSNTVSVTDSVDDRLVGVIRLGDAQPGNFSPLYKGQVLVHGMGFSPDHKTIAVVSIGSNMTNPAGSAIVNAVGPIRQIVQGEEQTPRRYLAAAEDHADKPGPVVQVQLK
jgi:hypothetical protein